MMDASDWAKPFIRELDDDLFYHYVDIFSENDWELDEFARQMREVVAATKENCTKIRKRMESASDKARIALAADELRAERERYALYTTRYSQYFGSVDPHSTPPASVVYHERRFFREVRSAPPLVPFGKPPPCPGAEEETSEANGKAKIHSEIDSTTICDVALELTANNVITNLIGDVQSTSTPDRRQRVQDSTKRHSLLRQFSDDLPIRAEMNAQEEENNNLMKHFIVDGPTEALTIDEHLVGHGAIVSIPSAEEVSAEIFQSSEPTEHEHELDNSFEIVSNDEVSEIVERICEEVVLSRNNELTPLQVNKCRIPMDPVATSRTFHGHEEFVSETDAKTCYSDLLVEEVSRHTETISSTLIETARGVNENDLECLLKEGNASENDAHSDLVIEVSSNATSAVVQHQNNSSVPPYTGKLEAAEVEVSSEGPRSELLSDALEAEDIPEMIQDDSTVEDSAEEEHHLDEQLSQSDNCAEETSAVKITSGGSIEPTCMIAKSCSEDLPSECVRTDAGFRIAEVSSEEIVQCEPIESIIYITEKTAEILESPLPVPSLRIFNHDGVSSDPPARTYLTTISPRPYSTAHFSYQTCSTTVIPCPLDEESRLITESSDVRTDPSYTVDVDEEFEEIGDDEFERAEKEVIYDNAFVPEENAYDVPPTPLSQRSSDEMREIPSGPPTARPVSPLLTLGRQRQVELGITLHEEDEIAYEEQEQERQRKFQEIYAPPVIPQIAINLVESSSDVAHLYDDDEHIYEEIDDYAIDKEECGEVYSEPPVPAGVMVIAIHNENDDHYDEPAALTPQTQFIENTDYSVPGVVGEGEPQTKNAYAELPYAVSGYYVENKEQAKFSYSTSSLPQTNSHQHREVYCRNLYEELDVPQSAGPTMNGGTATEDSFPYYVEPHYTTNAIRRMSRYNSWSHEAINNGLRSSKSLDYLNRNYKFSEESSCYVEPMSPEASRILPRSIPRKSEPPQPGEQKKTVYVTKPASRVTSSGHDWSDATPRNGVFDVQPSATHETTKVPLPPTLDLGLPRSQSNEHIGYDYFQQENKKLSPQSPTFVRIGVQTGTISSSSSEGPVSQPLNPADRKLSAERRPPVFSTVKPPSSVFSEDCIDSAPKTEENSLPEVFSEVKLRSARPNTKKQFAVNNNEITEDFRNSAVFKRISRTTATLLETEDRKDLQSESPVKEEEPIYKYEVVRTVRESPVRYSPVRSQTLCHNQIDEPEHSLVVNEESLVKPRKSWNVQVNTTSVPFLTPKALKMPELRDVVPPSNGLDANQFTEESAVCKNWNPAALINKLYEIDYMPRKESKRSRFVNMEGHLDMPTNDKNRVSELEKDWKRQYFRTKDGRLQWFATHFADEHPVGDVLLAGCDVDANRDDGTLSIHGGRDHTKMVVKAPLSLFDKWRQALLSHAASSILDSYVQPIARPLPHMTEKVAIIELGSCSIRGGVLTMEPSLPQSFFPALGCISDDGSIAVGADSLKPEARASGQLVQPIPATDPAVERYNMNKPVVRQCLQKVVDDLQIDPRRFKVLLSLPQNIPSALIGDLMKSLLNDVNFQSVSITRQPSLILYSYDVTTGVVVDIGERLNIVPVIDGYVVENAIVSLPYGAQQIRESLRSKLSDHNMGLYSFQSPVERLILRYVMEETCYVATDYEAEAKKCSENEHAANIDISLRNFETTPEMQSEFKINSSRFVATEGLFKPKRWGLDTKALHELVNEAVQLSPIDSRRTLFRNIYLSGGTSLLPGLAERLEVELSALVPHTIHVQVHMSPWRYHAAYLGAQIVASSTQFDKSCVNKDNLGAFLVQLQSSAF